MASVTPPSSQVEPRRRFKAPPLLVALSLSLFIHLTALFLLRPSPVRPIARPRTSAPIEIDIYRLPGEAAAPPSLPPSPGAPAQRTKTKGRVPAEPTPTERLAALRQGLGASDAPLARRDGDAPAGPRPKFYGSLLPSTVPESENSVKPVPDRPLGLHAPAMPKDLVGSIAQEVLGPHRVQSGEINPYFFKLHETLTEVWNTSRAERKFFQPPIKPASVRLTQARSGHLVSAELIASFNDPTWDRGLLADLKQAAHRLPEPPSSVFAGHQYVSSSWSFRHSTIPITDFDIVNVFDKRAIPKPSNSIVLLSVELSD